MWLFVFGQFLLGLIPREPFYHMKFEAVCLQAGVAEQPLHRAGQR
jgi:hypothetical protein